MLMGRSMSSAPRRAREWRPRARRGLLQRVRRASAARRSSTEFGADDPGSRLGITTSSARRGRCSSLPLFPHGSGQAGATARTRGREPAPRISGSTRSMRSRNTDGARISTVVRGVRPRRPTARRVRARRGRQPRTLRRPCEEERLRSIVAEGRWLGRSPWAPSGTPVSSAPAAWLRPRPSPARRAGRPGRRSEGRECQGRGAGPAAHAQFVDDRHGTDHAAAVAHHTKLVLLRVVVPPAAHRVMGHDGHEDVVLESSTRQVSRAAIMPVAAGSSPAGIGPAPTAWTPVWGVPGHCPGWWAGAGQAGTPPRGPGRGRPTRHRVLPRARAATGAWDGFGRPSSGAPACESRELRSSATTGAASRRRHRVHEGLRLRSNLFLEILSPLGLGTRSNSLLDAGLGEEAAHGLVAGLGERCAQAWASSSLSPSRRATARAVAAPVATRESGSSFSSSWLRRPISV